MGMILNLACSFSMMGCIVGVSVVTIFIEDVNKENILDPDC
jgi:hypothetical protein